MDILLYLFKLWAFVVDIFDVDRNCRLASSGKRFSTVDDVHLKEILFVINKLECLSLASFFHIGLMLVIKVTHLEGKLLTLLANT